MLWPIISGKGIGGKQTRHASIINRLYSSSTEVHEPKGRRRRTFSLRLQCFSSSSHQPQKSIFSKENFLLYKRQLTCDWLLLFSFLKIILRNFCPSLLDKFDYCCHNETFFQTVCIHELFLAEPRPRKYKKLDFTRLWWHALYCCIPCIQPSLA